MTDNTMHPAGGDPGQPAGLDAVLAARDERLLAAIRSRLDPVAGLAKVIADAALLPFDVLFDDEASGLAVPAAASWPALACDVSVRLASLRFTLLDLRRRAGGGRLSETAAVLIGGAAANLKDLGRGLAARELTCCDAVWLLDQVDLALAKARDSQPAGPPPWQSPGQQPAASPALRRRAWLLRWLVCGPTFPALLTVAVPMLAAALAAAALPVWVARLAAAGFWADTVMIPLLSAVIFVLTLAGGAALVTRVARRGGGPQPGADPAARLQDLRADLSQIRPDVVGQFGALDRCAAHA
ncbi:MAG TPA: hypothetical protein VH637_14930 [Streptosporangiaceae bacterium]